MAKKIGITETVLRDAHQSLIATRMRTEEFSDILETGLSEPFGKRLLPLVSADYPF